jgi:hypothetical protein
MVHLGHAGKAENETAQPERIAGCVKPVGFGIVLGA